MKKKFPLILILILTLASCTSEENNQNSNETMLKSYTLTRDSQGKYSIDYELKENTSVDLIKNFETNTNEVHLFYGDVAVSNKQSQVLSLNEDRLNINFYEDGNQSKYMYLEDEEITLQKGNESLEFLDSYSITDLGNDNYLLNFKTKEGISVGFEYNDDEEAYEIHLQKGTSKTTEFSKTYVKTLDVLKIDFVNYINNVSAKNTESTIKKPKFITS